MAIVAGRVASPVGLLQQSHENSRNRGNREFLFSVGTSRKVVVDINREENRGEWKNQ